jgi:hypothetical protein
VVVMAIYRAERLVVDRWCMQGISPVLFETTG